MVRERQCRRLIVRVCYDTPAAKVVRVSNTAGAEPLFRKSHGDSW
jgi:hypothetical protein